jgi:simple sugar transport system permease protein/ribose transport system permease protein
MGETVGVGSASTTSRPGSPSGRWSELGPRYGALAALVALVVVNALFTPNFATASNLWSVLLQVSTVLLVAIGMTLVIATGGVDLSVGSVMAVAAAIAAVMLDRGIAVAVLAALAGALAIGALNGALVAYLRVQPIVVTLATLIAARGLAQVISRDGQLIPIANPTFEAIGQGFVGPIPTPVVIALVVAAAAAFLLRATPFGRYVLAVGGNRPAARLAGVPVARTVVTVYAASGVLAGLAGLIVAARLSAADAAKIGLNMELDAIAAAVVGGTALTGGRATILGTVIGALIMQTIATSFNMLLVPYSWSLAFKAGIILIAVYLQRPRRV